MKDIYRSSLLVIKEELLNKGSKKIYTSGDSYLKLDLTDAAFKEIKNEIHEYLKTHDIIKDGINESDLISVKIDKNDSSIDKSIINIPKFLYSSFRIYTTMPSCLLLKHGYGYVKEIITGKYIYYAVNEKNIKENIINAATPKVRINTSDDEYNNFKNYLLNKEYVKFVIETVEKYYLDKYKSYEKEKASRNKDIKRLLKK